jgi:GAF domain-containing protein
MQDDTELGKSLTGLSGVALSAPLQVVLTKIANFAAQAIPGAEGAGLALIEAHRPDTVVASALFVHHVDDAQYRLGEGPCIQACAERSTQMSPHLSDETRWPRFGAEAGRLGVQSALSLPLLAGDALVGSLNVYAHKPDAFTEEAVRIGELFAEPSAISVANARLLVESQRLAQSLTVGLTDQAAIHQAVGILMGRTHCTVPEALQILHAMSQTHHTDLVSMARRLRGDPALPIPTPETASPRDDAT